MKKANHELYRHVYLGEPVGASEMAIIKFAWLEAATDAHIKLGWKAKGAVIAAHDPSDTGPDAKGYAVRHGSVVKRVCEGLLMDINEGADWASSLAVIDDVDHFLFDGDGLGAGLRRQITDYFSGKKVTVTMFKGSESPFDEDAPYQAGAWTDEVVQGDNVRTIGDVFRNKRAQFYYTLADRLYRTYRAVEHGEYADPDEMLSFDKEAIGENILNKLFAELTQIQRKFNGNGKLELMQVGDAFTIAGVNSVHQITKDTTGQPQVFRVLAVSGTTVTISPKILPVENADVASRPYANVDAKPAESAAITILNKNAAPANLFWADGSVELMYGKLAFPTGQGPQVMTATTEQGATLIMSYAFDHIKGVTTARFTTLYGCSVLVPEYTGIVIAGQ